MPITKPDPLDLAQYQIEFGDTTEFIAKMTGTQTDLDAFASQLNTMCDDIDQVGVDAEAARDAAIAAKNEAEQIASGDLPVSALKSAVWDVVTTAQALVIGGFYRLQQTAALSLTLPAFDSGTAATLGQINILLESDAAEHNVTFLRNGETIEGVADDLTIRSTQPRRITLDNTNGSTWRVTA